MKWQHRGGSLLAYTSIFESCKKDELTKCSNKSPTLPQSDHFRLYRERVLVSPKSYGERQNALNGFKSNPNPTEKLGLNGWFKVSDQNSILTHYIVYPNVIRLYDRVDLKQNVLIDFKL